MGINLGDIDKRNYSKNYRNVGGLNLSNQEIPRPVLPQKQKSKKRTWFKKGALEDGYQFGDITKTINSTIGSAGSDLVKGVFKAGESIGDLMAYGGAQIVDWAGNHKYAKQVREQAAKDLSSKVFKPLDDRFKKDSILGEKSEDVVNSIGNMVAQGAVASKFKGIANIPLKVRKLKFNLPTTALIQGASGGMSEAVNKGAEDWQIWLKGAGSGLAEGLSESLFGTFGMGGSDLDDAIVKSVTKKINNAVAKNLAKAGIKATGEGVEEVASYLLDYAGGKALDYVKNKAGLKGVDIANEFNKQELWDNFVSGAIASGIGTLPSTIHSIKGNNKGFDANRGVEQFQETPSVSDIVENAKPQQEITVQDLVEQEKSKENGFRYIEGNNENINSLNQSMSKYFDNSERTQQLSDTISKIIADKGYKIEFDDTITNPSGNLVNAQIKNSNGNVEIKINPNSPRAVEFLMVHEITHAIETDSMRNLVMDYAKKNVGFNQALENLKETYGTNEVSDEVLADVSGQLFGNQEFINSLSTKQPNIFKRIYNKIVELANKITGNSNEALFIRDLRNKWENAYRNVENNVKDVDYSQQELKPISSNTSTGEILSDGKYFYKNNEINGNTTEESKIYNILKNNSNVLDAEIVEINGKNKIKTPKLNIISIDDIKPEKRTSIGKIIKSKNFDQVVNAINDLSNNGYLYNDEIQLAYDRGDVKLMDFSNSQIAKDKTSIEIAKENLNQLAKFFRDFNQETYADMAETSIEVLDKTKEILKDENVAEFLLSENTKANKLVKEALNKAKGKLNDVNNIYYVKNARAIQKDVENIIELDYVGDNTYRYVLSDKPINKNIQNEYEITPIYEENYKKDNTKYSQQLITDNKGRELSKEQQEYFKDSKVRDENGNLLEVYHGSPSTDITTFKIGRGNNSEIDEYGAYFTDNKDFANDFSYERIDTDNNFIQQKGKKGKIYETYLNIQKPLNLGNVTEQELNSLYDYANFMGQLDGKEKFIQNMLKWQKIGNQQTMKKNLDLKKIANSKLYDGIIAKTDVKGDSKEYIIFNFNQVKDINNTNPTDNEDIRYSEKNETWQEHLEKTYKSSGTRTLTKDIIKKVERTIVKSNENLSLEETKELEVLKTMDEAFGLNAEETERLNYLSKKQDNLIKYPELKSKISFNDIKDKYSKYKNLKDFKPEALKTAESFVPGYKNTGKRTKQEWLQIANMIGTNFKSNDSNKLEKYAIQSWHQAKPNIKENLNRQGQSYVKFGIEDWINEIYKGAEVGKILDKPIKKSILPIKQQQTSSKTETPVETAKLLPTKTKTLNPNEISQLTKENANTTPILPISKSKQGNGQSKFAKNIKDKANMLSKETKDTLLSDEEVKTYEKVANKEALEKANARLNKNGKSEVINWLSKEKVDDTDVAEGWILLNRYQKEIAETKDTSKKDELNKSMVQIAKRMRNIGTKAGQTVQAFNIMNRLTPEGMVYYAQSELQEAFDKMSKGKTKEWIDSVREDFELKPEETQFIMDTMQEVQKMPDGYDKKVKLAEIQKLMTDKLPPEKGAGIKAWMRISMLFNPKTQVRNVLGNAVILPTNMLSDKIASIVDKKIASKTGIRTKGSSINNYVKGFKKGLYESYNDFKRGINTRDMEGNRFEVGTGKSFNNNTKIGKALNRTDDILSFMLDAGDRGFYEASFVNSINNQMVLNNVSTPTQEMVDIATNEALSRTWQDNNAYTRFVLNVRKMLNGNKSYGVGDILIPFAKTPANLTKAIVDYSPAGMIGTIKKGIELKRSLSNGQYTSQLQHQFVDSLGKATAGTMLYILGMALAKAGITTGDNDEDKDVSNFMKNALGKNSFSINIGGKSYSYSWMQPIASPLAITANISKKKKEDAGFIDNVLSNLDVAGNILLEQSFMDSINTVLNNRDGAVSGLKEAFLDLPSRAIPTLFKQIADMVDTTQRTSFEYDQPVKTTINKIKSKIPFLTKTLTPVYDTLGRPVMKYGGKSNLFNVFLNPANVNSENISEAGQEIYNLYQQTGDKTIMPRVAPYYINQKGQKIKLTSEQKSNFQKISGGIIEQGVKELMNNKVYNKLNDEQKSEIVKDIVDYSYNVARELTTGIPMSNTYEKINQYVMDGGKPSDYYTHKEEIDYAYTNPSKYQLIRQISTYDDYKGYNKNIEEIRDKTNSDSRKSAVINYVNSLKLTIPKKAILIKMYYKSFRDYDNNIVKYINEQNIPLQDKEHILRQLGFKIENGRVQ